MPSSQITSNYDLGYTGYKPNFKMIENYIYLHHINKFIVLPSFIDSVQDSQPIKWEFQTPLSRSAPIYSYASSGPRTVQVSFNLHRDLMQDINRGVSNIGDIKEVDIDYIDTFIKYIQASVLPDYQATSKVVNPPIVSLKLGNDIFIKGVVSSNLGITYRYPILKNGRFAEVQINLTISEIDPYSARDVIYTGSYRSNTISTTLDRKDSELFSSPSPSTNLDSGRAVTNDQGFKESRWEDTINYNKINNSSNDSEVTGIGSGNTGTVYLDSDTDLLLQTLRYGGRAGGGSGRRGGSFIDESNGSSGSALSHSFYYMRRNTGGSVLKETWFEVQDVKSGSYKFLADRIIDNTDQYINANTTVPSHIDNPKPSIIDNTLASNIDNTNSYYNY